MNTYILWTRTGNCYLVDAPYSFEATAKLEAATGETVSSWSVSDGRVPRCAVRFAIIRVDKSAQ